MEPNTTLILEGGAMRGLFTSGVLDVFMENDLYFPQVAGVSAGALNGVNYAAHQPGRSRAVNLVLMGRLSRYFDLPEEVWQNAITNSVPEKFLELNRKAFHLGRNS